MAGMLCLLLIGTSAFGQASPLSTRTAYGIERGAWRLEFDNDAFFKKDNKISSGWSLQRHTPIAENWATLQETPNFVRQWGSKIPTLTADGLVCRAGIAMGQITQTPDDLSRRDLIKDDVPYAGALTIQTTWYAYSDKTFRGFEIIAGVVGPPALAEQTQKTVHKLIGSGDPNGWDNQLSTEPVINFNYMRKRKIWCIGHPTGMAIDTTINANFGLGNLFTQASASVEARFGYNMPGGFVFVPDPIGYSMHYKAALNPPNPRSWSLYGSVVLRETGILHTIFLDGNTFTDSHSVDKQPFVAQAIAGLHFELQDWSIQLNAMVSSDNVNTKTATLAEGNELIGTLIFETRF